MTKHKDCHLFILFTVTFLFLFSNLIAQEKHQLFLKGLKAPVEVLRDEWGVNHIYAANQHDLFLHKVIVLPKIACFNLKYGGGKQLVAILN
jgi:hypothetical protein